MTNQTFGVVPYPHQVAGADFLDTQPRAILADEVGLGKTIQAALVIERASHHDTFSAPGRPDGPPIVWVTDAALISQAVDELRRLLPNLTIDASTHRAWSTNPSKKATQEWTALAADLHVVVISYDTLRTRLDTALVSHWRPHILVLDEIMAVKGGKTNWEAVRTLSARAHRCIGLTATPVETVPTETWAALAAVGTPNLWDQETFDREFVEWAPTGTNILGEPMPPRAVGFLPGAETHLREYLRGVTLRRTAQDIGLSLPTLVRKTTFVPLTPPQQKQHDRYATMPGLHGHQKRAKAARYAAGSSATANEFIRLVTAADYHQTPKVIVFSEFQDVLNVVCERLRSVGVSFVRVDGGVDRVGRAAAVAAFRDPAGPRVLVGSSVLERGLNLQTCGVLVSLDSSWNPAREVQREGRIRRLGSLFPWVVHHTVLPDVPDARRKAGVVAGREAVASQVLAGPPQQGPCERDWWAEEQDRMLTHHTMGVWG
ncbi:DEAD/DEAH box helicase [Cellulosimicrobium cellulans]|uniref:DEAD/DEAH box helicase n=1 Tax=Cellulosimicrobium cellulans TaxID=1710 RepID=UPI0036EA8B0B